MSKTLNLDEIYTRLKKSFVFRASLGSKELFHSNIWAWILENENINKRELLFNLFFPDVKYTDMEIRREWEHLDLSIFSKSQNNVYVIENKMKSIPTKEQLEKYSNKLNENKQYNFIKGVLTGIESPDWIDKVELWTFVSYKNICNTIRDIANYNSGKIKEFLDSYADMLDDIFSFLKYYDEIYYKKLPLWMEESKYASELKIWDLVQKREENRFVQLIINDPRYIKFINKCNKNIKLENYVGFYNGKFTIDIKFECFIPEYKTIGIQIEGNEYRRAVQEGYSLTKNAANKVNKKTFDKYKNYGWFRDNNNGIVNYYGHIMKSSSRKNEFCKYNGIAKENNKYYTYVYQYVKLDVNKYENTYDFISELLFKDLELAYSLAKKSF